MNKLKTTLLCLMLISLFYCSTVHNSSPFPKFEIIKTIEIITNDLSLTNADFKLHVYNEIIKITKQAIGYVDIYWKYDEEGHIQSAIVSIKG